MKIQTDSEGFLIGGKREDFRTLIAKSGDVLKEVRLIRKMLEARRKGSARNEVAQPAPRRRTGLRSSPAAPRDVTPGMGYGEAVARGVAAPQRRAIPGSVRQRDARGRFEPDGGSPAATAAQGHSGDVAAPRRLGKGAQNTSLVFPKSQDGTSGIATRLRGLNIGGGDIAQVDPLIAATREITDVVGPIGRAFGKLFGRDPEKKKVAWFKRIFDTLKKLPEKIGERVSINVPGNQAGGGIGDSLGRFAVGGMGLMKGLLKRTPVIGTAMALAGGLFSDSAIAGDESLDAGQRKSGRLANAGRTAGTVGGSVLGGLAGFAIGGPIGAAIGAAVGPMLVRAMAETLSPLIGDAVEFISTTSSKIADLVMNGVGWLGQTGEKLMTFAEYAASKAKQKALAVVDGVKNKAADVATALGLAPVGGFMKKLAHVESGDNPNSTAQRDRFLAGKGTSTASGRYQFLDSTFAGELERSGSTIPAAAGLVGMAKSYNADRRGTRAKARDPAYKKLFDAKLDPAVADPLAESFTERNRKMLAAKGIVNPSDAQLYSVHLTGNTKAAEVMQLNPNAPVSAAFNANQIKGNEGLLANKSSVGDVFAGIDAKLNRVAAVASVPMRSVPKLNAAPPLQIPEMPRPITPIGIGALNSQSATAQQDTGQEMKDRNIALIQTGGLGR